MRRQKPHQIIECTIQKLVHGGQGMAYVDGKTVFVWNALPGEIVMAEVIAKRKGILEAVTFEIIKASPERIEPVDPHFIATAAWQVITPEAQRKYKIEIAKEVYAKIGKISESILNSLSLNTDGVHTAYRNKMEFSFYEDENNELHLAFRQRGSRYPIIADTASSASIPLMKSATLVLEWLRKNKVSRWDLKSLVVRSNLKGETIIGLFVTNKDFKTPKVLCAEFSATGFHVFYSRQESPVSVADAMLFSDGDDFLVEDIAGTSLRYGIHSFFQVNIPVFTLVIEKLRKVLKSYSNEPVPLVDYYSGVGSISIPLASHVSSCELVEVNPDAVALANYNIENNNRTSYNAFVSEAEKMVEHITTGKVIILDPPRAGLHENIISRLLEVTPQLVIYLSCNIATQARDLALLQEKYEITSIELYDFFPDTPHIEALAVLRRKDG